jgi:hypothetical protein
MDKRETITHEELLKLISYNVKTGIFVSNSTGLRVGFVKDARGHRVIEIRGKRYPETRLAVFYVTESWPVGYVRNKSKRFERYTKFKDLVYKQAKPEPTPATEPTLYEKIMSLINSIWGR